MKVAPVAPRSTTQSGWRRPWLWSIYLTGRDDDNSFGNDYIYNEDEGNVDFGSPDLYDVQELIEISLEDVGIEVEHEAYDEVKQLKKRLHQKTL